MNRHIVGALALVIIGGAVMAGIRYLSPALLEQKQVDTSDAARVKGSITVGMDNFVGYFPLCSPDMKGRMLSAGYLIKCVDDKASYSQRMENLKSGELNFAVGTVDSLILTGPRFDFPGVIIAVLDESKGVDAIVARESEVKNLDDLKKKKTLKIAVTPDSPSSHLLKAVGVHFGVPMLMNPAGGWRKDAEGSSAAFKMLMDGSVDAAVLWEPDVSKALSRGGYIKILGTDQTSKLIVDILMVNRKFSEENPEAVQILLSNYFKSLKYYMDNKETLVKQLSEYAGIDANQTGSVLKGIEWVGLRDNAAMWFGVSFQGVPGVYGLFDAIEATSSILVDYGDFKSNPIPESDPRRLTLSAPLIKTFRQTLAGVINAPGAAANAARSGAQALALTGEQWDRLREVGTLKVRPIIFIRGSAKLSLEGKEQLDMAVKALKSYPAFRIRVEGHTNPRGDEAENRELSQKRAEAVSQYLKVTYNIEESRLRAVGMGSAEPLIQEENESQREYFERLSRVELHLMAEAY